MVTFRVLRPWGQKMGNLDNLDIKYDVAWILVENNEKLHM